MAQLTNFGQNNPLWRRVQRHAQMSALFGEARTAVSPFPTSLPSSAPPFLAEVTAVAPPSAISPTQPQPAQPSPAPAKEDDKNWRRLQKIHQLHQQKAEPVSDASGTVQRQMAETEIPTSQPDAPETTELAAERETAVPAPQIPTLPNQPPGKNSDLNTEKPIAPQPTDLAQAVGETLQRVAPGQKTDSSVELLPPSRPRPQPKTAPASSTLPQTAQPPTVQRQSKSPAAISQPTIETAVEIMPPKPAQQPPIQQRQSDVPTHPPHPAAEHDAVTPSPQPIQQSPTVQRQEDHSQVASPQPTAVPAPSPQPTTPPPITNQTTQPALPKLVPTDIGPLPSDLWELLGEPAPPTPEPKADAPTAVPTTSSPPISQRQAEAAPPKNVDLAPSPPAPAAPTSATAVTSEPTRPLAKPVTKRTASPNLPAFLDETAPAEQTAAAMPTVQRTAVPAPAKPTSHPLSETVHAEVTATAVPHHITPPDQPGNAKLNPVPLEQASRLTPIPTTQTVRQEEPAGHTAQPKPAPQPETHPLPTPARQRVEQPQPLSIQRMPDLGAAVGGLETAVAHNTPPAVAAPLATAANALLEESEPETETEPANATDLDLDELSRQVYQALKRKLAIERERGYGR
ncbi:MAG: hypothetical protein R3D55_01205 [Chloroflexota bacterium]